MTTSDLDPAAPLRTVATAGAALADARTWTEQRWRSAPVQLASAVAGLSAEQRLMLGMVLFGHVRYRAVAALTGQDTASVTRSCVNGMLRLREAGCRS